MRYAAAAVALLTQATVATAASQSPGPPLPRLVCLSVGETRDVFTANDLVPPLRAMREASEDTQAEAIDIQLCRTGGILVYDVTLLDEIGRVLHKLVAASSGALFSDRDADALVQPKPVDPRAPPGLPIQKGP